MTHQISANFTVEELLASDTAKAEDIENIPNWDALVQLVLLANNTLEGIRHICGDHPVLISSGFRNQQLNEAVGGAETSAHMAGAAADFTIPAFGSVTEVIAKLKPYMAELEIDQLIDEYGSWVHVGRAPSFGMIPRNECFKVT